MTAGVRVVRDLLDEAVQRLEHGVSRLGLDIGEAAMDSIRVHLDLLTKWNRAYNLTAIDDPSRAVAAHVLDSLAVCAHLEGQRVIDVGTGAGFPGLPLAFARSELDFVLLDSRGKKIRFVEAVIRATGAANVETVQERVERYPGNDKFDTLVARAFSSLVQLYQGSRHLLGPRARILAMKGEYPDDELRALGAVATLRCEVVPLDVPYLDAARHLVIIEPRIES
ncbi:MAG: 16S rRNA (guanine(527)-N(7))-methyltransferase RsmG [Proteobacteria bacterium]|nr:MAG: 16S rRNA (guanine(527)-N(7))-methyltransferase RsmG [Pseudomonadota bacterium]